MPESALALPLADGHPVNAEGVRNVNLCNPGLDGGQTDALGFSQSFFGGVSGSSQGASSVSELLDDLRDDELGSGGDGAHRCFDLGVVSGDEDSASLLGDIGPGGVDVHGSAVISGVSGVGVVGHSRLMNVRGHVVESTHSDVDVSTRKEMPMDDDPDPVFDVARDPQMFSDEFLDRIDDAIEDALLAHAPHIDSRCSCGAVNNVDGDVLHAHRVGAVSEAVRKALKEGLSG